MCIRLHRLRQNCQHCNTHYSLIWNVLYMKLKGGMTFPQTMHPLDMSLYNLDFMCTGMISHQPSHVDCVQNVECQDVFHLYQAGDPLLVCIELTLPHIRCKAAASEQMHFPSKL